jgi:DNA topoisomerase I
MEEPVIQLSHKEYLKVDRNYEKAAAAVKLVYVKDSVAGIQRVKNGKGFTYIYDSKPLQGEAELERIRKLVIPPAWENVWICPLANGHIQATGIDLRGRKQYRYHSLWNTLRNETKFHRLLEFGKRLPALRLKIEKDFARKDLSFEKVLAVVLSVMERTYIRIGNNGYEKLYGSYGLTTLKDKHVAVSGDSIKFMFKGKKGVEHDISLKNKKLARAVKECRDIPGKELFQYYGEDGKRRTIDSGAVNSYIQTATGYDFTTKDFRTWAGSVHALQAFRSIGEALSATDKKKNIVAVLDMVSKKLGNTRTVCKKYYVHPGLVKLYEEDKLNTYLKELDKIEEPDNASGLTREEEILMKILKKH